MIIRLDNRSVLERERFQMTQISPSSQMHQEGNTEPSSDWKNPNGCELNQSKSLAETSVAVKTVSCVHFTLVVALVDFIGCLNSGSLSCFNSFQL